MKVKPPASFWILASVGTSASSLGSTRSIVPALSIISDSAASSLLQPTMDSAHTKIVNFLIIILILDSKLLNKAIPYVIHSLDSFQVRS